MERIHDRWVGVRLRLGHRLMQPLSARITNFPVQETQVTKSTKTVIEMRGIVETNQDFKFLEECIDWLGMQLVILLMVD